MSRDCLAKSVLVGFVVLFVAANAWVSDDAFISLRTVENFLSGYGLRWNVLERVQAFTHPLWLALLIITRAISGNAFVAAAVLGIVVTTATIAVIVFGLARRVNVAVAAVSALLLSPSFVDFSTGGLENPLTGLLLALFCAVGVCAENSMRRHAVLVGLFSLLALTRPDGPVLVLPALAYFASRLPLRSAIAGTLIGLSPLLAWEGFSLAYYGALLPNTALAKLSTGVPRSELFAQGLQYMQRQVFFDGVSVLCFVAGVTVGFVHWRSRPALGWLSIGMVMYLLYLTLIGGDFMAGRFFTPPLVLSICILSIAVGIRPLKLWATVALLAALLLVGGYAETPTWRRMTSVDGVAPQAAKPRQGIVDERAFYGGGNSLAVTGWGAEFPQHWLYLAGAQAALAAESTGPKVRTGGAVGMFGYAAGPNVHIVDANGLTDPLLARLPVASGRAWRIGHFARDIPQGYLQSVLDDTNRIIDPGVARYWEHVRRATRDPIWTFERWTSVFIVNAGLTTIDTDDRRHR